jgi:hypothetical protein
MSNTATKILTDQGLPGWAKGVIAITLVAGIGIGVYVGFRFVKKKLGSADFKDTIKDGNSELVDLSKVEKASFPDSTYSGWANSIFTMLTGCDAYKNETAVTNILFQLKNSTDWLKLQKAYGVREMEGCWSSDYQADLPTTLKKEMLETSISQINSVFASRKMKYRI